MDVDIPRLIGQKELQIAHLQASLQETSAQFQAAMLVWALVEGLFAPLRESLLVRRAEAKARLAIVPRHDVGTTESASSAVRIAEFPELVVLHD